MGYFSVRYDSRVVIYKHKMFIRLATENQPINYHHLHSSNPNILVWFHRVNGEKILLKQGMHKLPKFGGQMVKQSSNPKIDACGQSYERFVLENFL